MTFRRYPPPARARGLPIRFSLLLALLPATSLSAQGPYPIQVERFTLPNGLEVILSPDRTAQVAAVHTWYLAGSRDEPLNRAGLARLFERLMFAGSERVPPGGHAALIEQNGGRVTAEIEDDVSRFTETVPSNRLEQALWLEAERMSGIVINDTTVNDARAGLIEDLRSRVAEAPYAGAIMEGAAALFDSTRCGYAHPPLGRLPTLRAITTTDAREFFARYYRPGNARMAITGDFDPVATRALVTRFFADIPAGPAAPVAECPAAASRAGSTLRFNDRQAARPAAGQFYRLPPHDHADTPALQLLGIIMGRGQGSRLSSELTRTLGAAAAVQAGILGTRRGPGVFALFAVAGPGLTGDSLAALLAAQAAWAGSDITAADLTRARNIYLATAVSARERASDVAETLLHAATFHGNPDAANTEPGQVLAVTLADLKRVAAAWLRPDNAVTLVVTPESGS